MNVTLLVPVVIAVLAYVSTTLPADSPAAKAIAVLLRVLQGFALSPDGTHLAAHTPPHLPNELSHSGVKAWAEALA